MNLSLIRTTLRLAGGPLLLAAVACGDGPEPLTPILTEQIQATQDECGDTGGVRIRTGPDADGDGVLGENEVEEDELVCAPLDGEPGEQGEGGADALVRTSPEPAGANCAEGGVRVESGVDADQDGTLGPSEVTSTTFVCDQPVGEDGLDFLVRTSSIAPGAECDTETGVLIESGLDDDRSGTLDDPEVDFSQAVCEGLTGATYRVEVEVEPPGPNCPAGGQRLRRGPDRNRDGLLQASEIEDVSFVCDALATLVRTSTLAPGADCANGGTRVDRGLDVNGNQALEPTEIVDTAFACAGSDGTSVIVDVTDEPAGVNCRDGGVRIDSGRDLDGSGSLEMNEVESVTFACDAADGEAGRGNSAVRVTAEPAGANCALGGNRVETGPDTNGNGQLDDDEVVSTQFFCDREDVTTLVNVVETPPDADCINGGRTVESGVDVNGNGTLDSFEVTSSVLVCTRTAVAPLAFSTMSGALADATVGIDYSVSLEAVGGQAGGYQWSLAAGSSLPPGLSIDASGTPDTEISGVATQVGTFNFTVIVSDSFGAVDSRSFSIEVEPFCGDPNLFGTSFEETDVAITASIPSTAYDIAADTSTAGWLYLAGTSSLQRIRKDGSADEDLEADLNVNSDLLGYAISVVGDDIYLVSDETTTNTDRVTRLSDDGGATFAFQNMLTFTSTPTDIRGVAVDVVSDTMFVVSHDTPDCQIWEANIGGTLPATATLFGTFTGYGNCSGLAIDSRFLYTTSGSTPSDSIEDAVVRIDRLNSANTLELFADFFTFNLDDTGYNDLEVQDSDGDGISELLFVAGDSGDRRVFCRPGGDQQSTTPDFSVDYLSDGLANDNGIAVDAAVQTVWYYDESPDELVRVD